MSKPKGEDLNIKTKLIQFKRNSPYEVNACNMIDKVRYYQSKFIIKLINDFFEHYHLTMDSPYELIRAVVTSYIDGKQIKPTSEDWPTGSVNEDTMTKLLLQQQVMLQQLMAQQMLVNYNAVSPASAVDKTEIIPVEKNEQQTATKPSVLISPSHSPVSSETSYKSVDKDDIMQESSFDDVDTDDDYITDLTSAFSNIL